MSKFESGGYTWDWELMTARWTATSNDDYDYSIRWNEELDALECKSIDKIGENWSQVLGHGIAEQNCREYLAEQELLKGDE